MFWWIPLAAMAAKGAGDAIKAGQVAKDNKAQALTTKYSYLTGKTGHAKDGPDVVGDVFNAGAQGVGTMFDVEDWKQNDLQRQKYGNWIDAQTAKGTNEANTLASGKSLASTVINNGGGAAKADAPAAFSNPYASSFRAGDTSSQAALAALPPGTARWQTGTDGSQKTLANPGGADLQGYYSGQGSDGKPRYRLLRPDGQEFDQQISNPYSLGSFKY